MRGRGRGSPDDKSVVELSWKEGNQNCGKAATNKYGTGNAKGDIIQYNEQKIKVLHEELSAVCNGVLRVNGNFLKSEA